MFVDLDEVSDHQHGSIPATPSVNLNGIPGSRSSTDIEVWSADRSPARKMARSPGGGGITVSRLDFTTSGAGRAGVDTSPTRKIAGSNGSASVASAESSGILSLGSAVLIPPSRSLPPLNDLGRALGMETFLDLCNFKRDDMVPRVLINMAHIRHWEFFYRNTNVIQLQHMGFPYPIASQLMNGAEYVGATHTEIPTGPGDDDPASYTESQAPGDDEHPLNPDSVDHTPDGKAPEEAGRPESPVY
ncbi:hypothetical protein PGT21_016100 [Puccinia graminis f. sp. tritici]|uniref:Uncharacterized protein n=1 Tax=Puccinia graminis f. sp. tritici TaxID=56615 RepID=A0A5B0LTS4_PUCGR|nr:hypothetical protein PGTUg99_002418 [Puccinia graminis f. sp. tritici]KAA1071686.1 hypothetical protein PGT21_016100 [Puccinia graminis f. sp. tritici]